MRKNSRFTYLKSLQAQNIGFKMVTTESPTDGCNALLSAQSNALKPSEKIENAIHIKGYDFNQGINWPEIMNHYFSCGFQASQFGLAIEQVNMMIESRKNNPGFKLFFGYTSNMISCGVREIIRFLAQHRMIDVIVTSAGGIEEDLIKCLAPTILGDFDYDGASSRTKGLNRIGNLIMPNDNYVKFEKFLMPILDECLEQQQTNETVWSPSKIIRKLGESINNTESVYYWAARNNIPVYCPAITDGSIGDMMYFHSIQHPGLVVDLVQDIKSLNTTASMADMTGMLILGGGLIKHHIFNANMMRNGAEFAVVINTAHEYDGSDAGAPLNEAVSWGKIRSTAKPVKVHAEASLLFPILVANTFAKHHHSEKQ